MAKKILAIALLSISTAVIADTGFYAGFGVSAVKADIDRARAIDQWAAAGNSTANVGVRSNTVGFKVFGGYEFNRYVGLELSYADLGTFKAHAQNTAANTRAESAHEVTAYALEAVGTLPVYRGFSVFGKAGAALTSAKDTMSCSGVTLPGCGSTVSEDEYNYKLGLGAQYAFANGMALRLDVDRYFDVGDRDTTSEATIDTAGLSLSFRF